MNITTTSTGWNDEDDKDYNEYLRRRQEHLKQIRKIAWRPCLHDACTQCHGTGIKSDGSYCVHAISCPCPKCSPTY